MHVGVFVFTFSHPKVFGNGCKFGGYDPGTHLRMRVGGGGVSDLF